MEDIVRAPVGSGEEILVIEDSPTQAEHLCHILRKHGYRASIAGNGRDALDHVSEKRPALIISDIIMPEMDGYELCRRIKAKEESRNTPVILLTSLSDPHDVIRGLECGADNFITKPYKEKYLLSRISYLLANRYLRKGGTPSSGIEIDFAGQRYVITADSRQVLDLLLCTYETAIQKNNELIRARDELNRANEQLETANRELEAFNYTVSHDLRAPLTNISGYSQILLEMYADTLNENCTGFIREIFRSTMQMNDLIDDLLEFSRLTHQELRREEVDLSAMALAITAELRMSDLQRQADFRIAEGVTCNGDPGLLHVVLANLLGNAWKYTGKEETALIEFGVAKSGGESVYYVRDNGVGFDMTDSDKLFGVFQRLHSKEDFEGSGIGLATVQRIIKRHGGRIWAKGELGAGAVFSFTMGGM